MGILATWTVLIYMAAADPDLLPYAYRHLNEMEAAFPDPARSAASTAEATVVVELDLGTPSTRRIRVRRAEVPYAPRRCLLPPGCSPADIHSPVVETVDDETTPPAERLRRFLSWGIREYPSRYVLVVVWGHGDGFLDMESGARVTEIPSVRAALSDVSRDDLGGRPIALVAFDACLMQSVEVATELAPVARYLVGSEQIEDYLGLPYRTFLPRLNGTAPPPPRAAGCAPADAACEAAALLPALAQEAFRPGGLYAEDAPRARETMTLSAISAAALDGAFVPSLRALSRAIEGYLREDDLRRVDLQILLGQMPGFLGGSRDMGVFLGSLRALAKREEREPGARRLIVTIDRARAALERAVIAAAIGDRYATPAHAGMAGISVFLPHDAEELAGRIDLVGASRLYKMVPGFRGWLSRLFAE